MASIEHIQNKPLSAFLEDMDLEFLQNSPEHEDMLDE
jgi:hypothetical protein